MASLSSSANDVQQSLQRLLQKWDAAQQVWNDPVSREFQQQYLEPLHKQTRAAKQQIEKIAQVIASARQSVK